MNVVIAAGGTGGHLYPAVAVAREFLRQDPATRVVFVGTLRGIESTVLAHEGFELELIGAKPLMGKRLLERVQALAAVPASLGQSSRLLKKRQADLVIGVGGYTSPTVLLAAFLRRIPSVILEPNAYPGLANRVVAPLAQRIFLAFESGKQFFRQKTVRVVGMPVPIRMSDSSRVSLWPNVSAALARDSQYSSHGPKAAMMVQGGTCQPWGVSTAGTAVSSTSRMAPPTGP